MRPKVRFRKILVAIGNPRATTVPALTKAAQIAAACDAQVELFHDLSEPIFLGSVEHSGGMKNLLRAEHREALAGMERLAARLRPRGLKVTSAAEWDYPPHESIIRRAQRTGADLIVTHSRARHRTMSLLGYTDWALLRDSPVPVLLVKSARRYRTGSVLAAIDPRHNFEKPAGLDGNILREARAFSTALHGPLHVVHAYLPLPVLMPGISTIPARPGSRIELDARASARRALQTALKGMRGNSVHAHLIEAHPTDGILIAARRNRVELVVMGAVSRRGLKRLFIGNTAEQLLDEISCDLLIVKPTRFANPVPRTRRGVRLLSAPAFT